MPLPLSLGQVGYNSAMHVHHEGHTHAHDHSHGHSHGHLSAHDMPGSGVMAGAVAASLLLVATELVGGVAGHSIALISDAVHNLTDVPSLLIAWLAMRWAERPA